MFYRLERKWVMVFSLAIAGILTLVATIAANNREDVIALTRGFSQETVAVLYLLVFSICATTMVVLSLLPYMDRYQLTIVSLTLNVMAILVGLLPWSGFHFDFYQIPILILWYSLSGNSEPPKEGFPTTFEARRDRNKPAAFMLFLLLGFGLFLAFNL